MRSRYNVLPYVLLLVVAFGLRLPSFWADFLTTDESIFLTIGQRLADGGHLYADAWDDKPPLILWVYSGFVSLFGGGALTAIRVFTCLYVFVGAALFNQFILNYRFAEKFTLLPGLLYLVALSVPWYTQELNTEQLMSLPMLLSVILVVDAIAEDRRSPVTWFWLGLLCGLMVLTKYQAAFLVVGLLVSMLAVGNFGVQVFATYLGSLALTLGLAGFVLYLNGTLDDWYDISFRYSLDYLGLGGNPGEVNTWKNVLEYGRIWGVLLVLGFLGFLAMRAQRVNATIRQRKFETVFTWWLIFGTLSAVLGGRFYLHYLVLVLPAWVFFAFYFLQKNMKRPLRVLLVGFMLVMPAFTYVAFVFVSTPQAFQTARHYIPAISPDGWLHDLHHMLYADEQEQALAAYVAEHRISEGWIATWDPPLYHRLGLRCALPYTNYGMALYKMTWLPQNEALRGELVSDIETMAAVYGRFERAPVPVVIDPEGTFAAIKEHLPLLLAPYQRELVAGVPVYRYRP